MTITTDNCRVLSDVELKELRQSITDPNSPVLVIFEMVADLKAERDKLSDQLEEQNCTIRDLEETVGKLNARIEKLK